MVDRYLASLRGADVDAPAVPADGRLPEDQALAGHADADSGPEGPPLHVTPGLPAE
jgi:hypothetical protein